MARNYYSVYEAGTDRPICIHGTAAECAAALGISQDSFYNYINRIRRGLAPKKIEIYQDEEDDSDDEMDTC